MSTRPGLTVGDLPPDSAAAGELPVLSLGPAELADFGAATDREWLLTNGIGGFASGTVAGSNTRRYHGLLIAALTPPLGRTLLVSKVDARATYLDATVALTSNEYADGTIDPDGLAQLSSFQLEGTIPVWQYGVADALIEQRVWLAHGENTAYLRFSLLRASAPLTLTLWPFVAYRDYHSHQHGQGWQFDVRADGGRCDVLAFAGAKPLTICADRGAFAARGDWFWNFQHRAEAVRGLDAQEDLVRAAELTVTLAAGESVTLTFSIEASPQAAQAALAAQYRRQHALLAAVPGQHPAAIHRLILAADQFVVGRGAAGAAADAAGKTLIAGYPWFGDWGRDTMIALPGLTLSTQRHDVAAQILLTYAQHVSEGMLPNRFPDADEAPEYNTVDATLWYFHAVDAYIQSSGDRDLAIALYPVLNDIIDWHVRGTRYGIKADDDGLLRAGEPGVQLTWMDARVGDHVITPRIGKPVEINALWYRALCVTANLADAANDPVRARALRERASRAAGAFAARFWCADHGYLFDVVDGPEGNDAALRPNQIVALAIAPELLPVEQARQVVQVCARQLWTANGLRSLAPSAVQYAPYYRGGPAQRDSVYHQGTVWGWLLGPFAEAHYHAFGDKDAALSYLCGIFKHLDEAGLGSISEIFDGAPPHRPHGCFAQAWSVAEVLRVYLDLSSGRAAAGD